MSFYIACVECVFAIKNICQNGITNWPGVLDSPTLQLEVGNMKKQSDPESTSFLKSWARMHSAVPIVFWVSRRKQLRVPVFCTHKAACFFNFSIRK